MACSEPIWERFLGSKLTPSHRTADQLSGTSSGILDGRSVNLTPASIGSIALHADADTAGLMRELAMKTAAELFSDKTSQELARRNLYVDFVRAVLSCAVLAKCSGREKKADVAVRCIEAMHIGLVVEKPARDLLGVLLAELDDIDTDHVPLVVNAILAPLLTASRRQGGLVDQGQAERSWMSETAATGFLLSLELLPKVLGLTTGVAALAQAPPVPEVVRGLSGAQYRERVVSRLFRARWPGAVSIGICQALRDLDLGTKQLRVAVSRILRHLRKRAELHDLPPLTYQLLLLAGRGCKEAALEGVIHVFDRLDAAAEAVDREDAAAADGHIPMRRGGRLGSSSTEQLRFVEGTILLHFNFAMKQDHGLASCLLKGFQRRAAAPEIGRAFTPFRVALLLSMARIQRFGQPVLDLVQDIVTECLTYDHLREGSAWLEAEEHLARGVRRGGGGGGGVVSQSRMDADDEGGDGYAAGSCGTSTNSSAAVVERVLLAVVRSSRGWDHLVGSLLKLGLQLLDRGGAGGAGAGTGGSATGGAKGILERMQGSQSQRASSRASYLGRVVLMETFKTHEIVRRQVLTSVLEQVTARSQGVMGYVKLLGLLAERNPNLLLDDAEAVRDVFGYVSVLPPSVAERFLRAVAPLLRLRPRLQDSMVLPLRKALFSREERARLVAVSGLVLLLGLQSRSNANQWGEGGAVHGLTQLSQASQTSDGSIPAPFPPPPGVGLGGGGGCSLSLAEGFGLLRRCLTQQLVVRTKLYDGLLTAFGHGSLELQLDTVSLLVGHLRRYVNLSESNGAASMGSGGGGNQPLLLKRCLDPHTGDIVEPLPLLIGCLHRMLGMGRENLAAHEDAVAGGEEASVDSMLDHDLDRRSGAGAGSIVAAETLRDFLDELDVDLRRLADAVSSAELEDFGLDKVADFSPDGSPAARGNLAAAALLCGSYEALMQGALLLPSGSSASQHHRGGGRSAGTRGVPPAPAVRSLLRLFDRRQTLLERVRSALPTPAQQQRGKKGPTGGSSSSSNSSSVSSGSTGGGDWEMVGGGGTNGPGAGLPGYSPTGCFTLTLYPGGMPCLGMAFVEDLLSVMNAEADSSQENGGGEESDGDTERDPSVINADTDEPPTEAVKEDLGLQRLILETCRGHLRALRTSTAVAGAGLSVEVGGGGSTRGATASSAGGMQEAPQDEADATRAGKAATKRCTVLAPLLLKEVFRQLTECNTSSATKAAAAAAKTTNVKSSKGKGKAKSTGGGGGVGASEKKGVGRSFTPAESLSELALTCLEEAVCIAAYCSPRSRTGAARTGKLLATAYKGLPDSNVPPADSSEGTVAASVLGRHADALVQTLTSLIADDQVKEAEIVCRILSQLMRLIRLDPPALEAHAASLKVVCKDQSVNSPALAKAVICLYLQAHMSIQTRGDQVDALQDLAKQIRPCVGLLAEEEEDDDGDVPLDIVSFRIINNFTVGPVSEVTLSAMDACIDEVEYALRLLQKASVARQARVSAQAPEGLSTSLDGSVGIDSQLSGVASEGGFSSDGSVDSGHNSDSDSDVGGVRRDGGCGERDPLDRRETLMCDRLEKVMKAMTVLVGSRLEYRSIEKLVSCASRVFRAVTKVLKVRLALKRAYLGAGLKRVLESKKPFTKDLQSLLPVLEDEKGVKVTKHHISRQSKLVPELVYQVEQCDLHLLKLGKLCKGSLDLPKWVTNRVDRDFRFDRNMLATCQEEARASRARKQSKGGKRKGKGSDSANKKTKKTAAQSNNEDQAATDGDEEGEQEKGAGTAGRRNERNSNNNDQDDEEEEEEDDGGEGDEDMEEEDGEEEDDDDGGGE